MNPRRSLAIAGGLLLYALSAGVVAGQDWTSIELAGINGTYRDVAPGVEWSQETPIPMRFVSPSQELEIKSHKVALRPREDGTHDAKVWIQFQGSGGVVGEVSGTTLEDELELPLQEHEVEARIRIRRDGELYEIETVEVQPTLTVEIRSRLAGQLVELCESLLSLMGVVCGGLETRLSQAEVPLPESGETYYLPNSRLTEADRQTLDGYLESTAIASR